MKPIVDRFHGGKVPALAFLALGVLGIGLTGIGWGLSLQRAMYSYLFAWTAWFSASVGALILLGIFHAAKARWPVALRRALEAMASTVTLLPVLFLPIALGMEQLYPWHGAALGLSEKLQRLVHWQAPYSNTGFFLGRACFYFAVWIAAAELLLRFSRRQDTSGGIALTRYQRWLGAGSLPFVCLSFNFAVTDWVMSIEPRWYSSLFGVYFFAGAMLATLAVLTLACAFARGVALFGELLAPAHFASLGKLLLGFTGFWAYIAVSQYMLVWVANVPDEVPWYNLRTAQGWAGVAIFVGIARFVVPFFLLLSKDLKLHRWLLALVAGWILFAHVIDCYWMIVPQINQGGPRVYGADFSAWVGVGGLMAAFAIWRMRGHYTVPVGDPYLHESTQYAHL